MNADSCLNSGCCIVSYQKPKTTDNQKAQKKKKTYKDLDILTVIKTSLTLTTYFTLFTLLFDYFNEYHSKQISFVFSLFYLTSRTRSPLKVYTLHCKSFLFYFYFMFILLYSKQFDLLVSSGGHFTQATYIHIITLFGIKSYLNL